MLFDISAFIFDKQNSHRYISLKAEINFEINFSKDYIITVYCRTNG